MAAASTAVIDGGKKEARESKAVAQSALNLTWPQLHYELGLTGPPSVKLRIFSK